MGKYPFTIGSKFILFPLLGINYRALVAMSDEDDNEINNAGDHSALWFKLGIGADIFFLPASVTEKLFLKGRPFWAAFLFRICYYSIT